MPAIGALILAGFSFCEPAVAQVLEPGSRWVYTLIDGSQLEEDCPVCDRLTIPVPMRGTFELRVMSQDPLFTDYAVENIAFTAGTTNSPAYKVTGGGIYRLGGEVAVVQTLSLAVQIDNAATNKLCYLTNATGIAGRPWPMIQAAADQTNGTFIQQYHLDINAAPFREIWFATAKPFQAALWNPPTNAISAGDLLSMSGRVVRRNHQLAARLGIMPIVPNLGLKDVDVLPGGEIAFSIAQDIFSETLGPLHAGDLLSDQGRILRDNASLIAPFNPAPPPASGAGLNAVQVMDWGETSFSVQNAFYSATLGLQIQSGDLLSDRGAVLEPAAQLLAALNPTNATTDYGLKAIYVWPSREIWFATATGFYGPQGAHYDAGDLLSDHGYVVYRNWELTAAFGAAAGAPSLGLDALFLVSDVTAVSGPAALAAPQTTNQPPASLVLHWQGPGRVSQIERAPSVTGPYLPAGPPDTTGPFIDAAILNTQDKAYYRLREW